MGLQDFLSKLTESTDDTGAHKTANQANADAWDDGFVDSYETAETYDDYFTSHRSDTKTSDVSSSFFIDEEYENEPPKKTDSIRSRLFGRKPEKPSNESPEKSDSPDIMTFCPMTGTDANRICDAIIAGKYVHVKFDQLVSNINSTQDNHTTFLKILYATSGCAYAAGAEVFRIDENTLDFFVIPRGKRYASELPEDFLEVNTSMYNIPKN
ncbi:MAG TPA: hypothetical protein GXZ23_07135 [Clostridiales bacterium]|nr:hypothetical protein [Clostridiales bacterium]